MITLAESSATPYFLFKGEALVKLALRVFKTGGIMLKSFKWLTCAILRIDMEKWEAVVEDHEYSRCDLV